MVKKIWKARLAFFLIVLFLTIMFQASSLQATDTIMFQASSLQATDTSVTSSTSLDQGNGGYTLYHYTVFKPRDNTLLVASYYDMSQSGYYTGQKVRTIHQYRPDFKALFYRNLRDVYSYWGDEWSLFKANNWVLKDEHGNYVRSTRVTRNYLVDIGNPNYQRWVANKIRQEIDQYGFDGVFADCSLSARANEHFWSVTSDPINPRTGKHWTDAEVKRALVELHKSIKNTIGSKLLICNGIYHGSRFYLRANDFIEVIQASNMDGWMSEGWLNIGRWFTEEEWKQSLDFLIWTQERDNPFIPCACLEKPLPSGCTERQMAAYAVATTMLGIKSNNIYLHLSHPPEGEEYQDLFDKANSLGMPLEDYQESNGLYVREFSNGKVYVNPTADAHTMDGIIIQPHTGKILMTPPPKTLMAPPPKSLLPNPSAEEDSDSNSVPDYWQQNKGSDISGSWKWSTSSHNGARSLEMALQPNPSGTPWQVIQWRQYYDLDGATCPFTRGSTYRMRVWYQTENAKMRIYVGMWDSSHHWLQSTHNYADVRSATPSTWEQSDWITFTVPTNAKYIAVGMAIRLDGIDSGASQALGRADDFEVQQIT